MKRYAIAGRALRLVWVLIYVHHFLSIGSCFVFSDRSKFDSFASGPQGASLIQPPMIHTRTLLDYAHCVQILAHIF
jgi:hypothetical protein